MYAMKCCRLRLPGTSRHRSQHNPQGFSSVMPDGLREEMAAREQYLLIAGAPLPEGQQGDLFAGLSEGDTFMVEGPVVQAEPSAETQETEPDEQKTSPEFARLLLAEINRHVSLAEALRMYERDPRETRHATLYRQLSAAEQEIIYRIARHLRRLDAGAGKTEADPAVLREARRRDRADLRQEFLLNRTEVAYGRFQDNARSASIEEERAAWEELAALARASVELLKSL